MKATTLSFLFVWLCFAAFGQTATLSGKVRDENTGEPLVGANLLIGATGTTTDELGRYELRMEPGTYEMTVSYVGYEDAFLRIELREGTTVERVIGLTPASTVLQTATVTTGKYEQPLGKVTVSLEVLPPQLVENSNRYQLDEALQKVPGVNVIDGQANIRGGSGFSYGAGSRVLLLLNDMPILTADAGFPNWRDLPMETLDQIEVVKGAASALYGSAALNGIVNFRTTYPTLEPETKATLLTGMVLPPDDRTSQWWDRAPLTFGAGISHKRKWDKFDLVASAFFLNEETHNADTYRKSGRFNFNTRYRLTDRLAIGLNGLVKVGSNQDFFYWQSATQKREGREGTFSKSDHVRFNFDPFLTFFAPNGDRHKLQGRYYHVDNEVSADRANFTRQFYTEYQYQRQIKPLDMILVGGLVYQGGRVQAELYGDTTFISRNVAGYLQFDKAFGEKWNASLGLRYEYNHLDNPGFVYPRGRVEAFEETESKPVVRLGLNYQAADFTFIRASWGQGYRFPTIVEKFIFTNVGGFVISPSPQLRSETGWSAEVGVKQGLRIGAFEGFLDLAAFWSQYQNMMEFNYTSLAEGFRSINIGDTEIKGLELSLTGRGRLWGIPTTFLGGYLYIDPRFLEFDTTPLQPQTTPTTAQLNAINSSSQDNILKYRAPHSFKFDLESQLGNWRIGVAGNYTGFFEAVDQTLLFIVPGLLEFREKNNGGNFVLDLRTALQLTPALKVSVLMNNALNHEYTLRPGLLAPPRNLALRLDWNAQ